MSAEYQVVEADSIENLTLQINLNLDAGWEASGGISNRSYVVKNYGEAAYGNGTYHKYYQAMTKRK